MLFAELSAATLMETCIRVVVSDELGVNARSAWPATPVTADQAAVSEPAPTAKDSLTATLAVTVPEVCWVANHEVPVRHWLVVPSVAVKTQLTIIPATGVVPRPETRIMLDDELFVRGVFRWYVMNLSAPPEAMAGLLALEFQ